jgi:hypothetical protein
VFEIRRGLISPSSESRWRYPTLASSSSGLTRGSCLAARVMTVDQRKILGSSPRMTPLGAGACGAVHLRCTLRFTSSAHPGTSRDPGRLAPVRVALGPGLRRDERNKECAMVGRDWIPAFAGNAEPRAPLPVAPLVVVALVLRRTRSGVALLRMSALDRAVVGDLFPFETGEVDQRVAVRR